MTLISMQPSFTGTANENGLGFGKIGESARRPITQCTTFGRLSRMSIRSSLLSCSPQPQTRSGRWHWVISGHKTVWTCTCRRWAPASKTMPNYVDYDDASIGMAICVVFLIGVSGFVLMAGLGFSRRGWAKTMLWFVPPFVFWAHATLWVFVMLSYHYIP